MTGLSTYPRVSITEEVLREGVQITRHIVSVEDRLNLLRMLEASGLRRIVVGSFVSPIWTPQMADVDRLIDAIEPKDGVTYLAIALNERGRQRRREHAPPLTVEDLPELHGHLCDVFVVRNTNQTLAQVRAAWPEIVRSAAGADAREAGIGLSAAWGSNWRGSFSLEQRMAELERQWNLWSEAGIAVTQVRLADPMGWNAPAVVAEQLGAIKRTWPSVNRFIVHLHNQRGLALTSAYAALTALSPEDTLTVDSAVGGFGGCPYCGNGVAAGMAATEDLAQLLQELGIETGLDLYALAEAARFASVVLRQPLSGHVSRAGPLPRGDRLYAEDMALIETEEEAQHFRLGPSTYVGQRRPWVKA